MSTHYVAQLKVERIEKSDPPKQSGYHTENIIHTEKREVSEVTHMTIKAEDLQTLLDKLGKHIALIEDD